MSLQNRVEEFLHQTDSYCKLLDEQLDDNANRLNEEASYSSKIASYIIFILFLILLLSSILMIFKKIGKPLADFTYSANEIAAGRDAVIKWIRIEKMNWVPYRSLSKRW